MNETNPPNAPPTPAPGPTNLSAAVPVSAAVSGGGTGTSAVRGAVRKTPAGVFDPFGLRALIITWCLWLLASWSITLAISATVHAVRWVVFSAVFGLMAVWPALRLSQQLPSRFGGSAAYDTRHLDFGAATFRTRLFATMLDWFCLLLVFQVVVWPLMLVGRWTVQQTLWLDLAVLSWSLLTAVLIGLGRLAPLAWLRVVAMLLCVLLLIGEPIWMAVMNTGFGHTADAGAGRLVDTHWQMRISPLQTLWELTTTQQPYDPSGWQATILSTAAAGGLGLIVLAAMAFAAPAPDIAPGDAAGSPPGTDPQPDA